MEWPDWPFCSPRCKLIDLGRWLGGDYRIATQLGPDDEEVQEESSSPNSAAPSAVTDKDEA